MDIKDIYWLAGLLEGEGCFHTSNQRSRGKDKSITIKSFKIRLVMTDKDIVDKAAKMMGTNVRRNNWSRYRDSECKDVYDISFCGAKAIGWMMTLYPLMGTRRRAKINEIINEWKAYSPNPSGPKKGSAYDYKSTKKFKVVRVKDRPSNSDFLNGFSFFTKM